MIQAAERVKSTHKVEVVPVSLEPHPNADSLSIVRIFGYTVLVRTADWVGKDRGAYIVPDSVVDTTRPEFLFLEGHSRIKVKKLRGVMSQGLLIPAPEGAQIGDDVAELLGVTRYEPPVPGEAGKRGGYFIGGEVAKGPDVVAYKYDVDAWRRYRHLFVDGEEVVATEKVHGASARYVYCDGQMHCGSRTEWKKEYPSYDHLTVEFLTNQGVPEDKAKEIVERVHAKPKASMRNLWWQALTPAMEKFCQDNPGVVLYGEVYGQVQDLKYGHGPGQVSFIGFDLLRGGDWIGWDESQAMATAFSLPWVPVLYQGPYCETDIERLADGLSVVSRDKQIREGIVVKPVVERTDHHIGRVQLKIVSNAYLERQ